VGIQLRPFTRGMISDAGSTIDSAGAYLYMFMSRIYFGVA
jgi:hypothetical protein